MGERHDAKYREALNQENPVKRLRALMLDLDPWSDDYSQPTPKAPLAPYGQHSDPAAAFANFRSDLAAVFRALDALTDKEPAPTPPRKEP